nr:uncharacterized protein LOC115257457 [Aedes albopictus]
MDPKSDVPVVARRRRKAARQLRESTPDPSQRGAVTDGSQSQASDDQSGSDCRSTGRSTVDSSPRGSVNSKKSFIERAMEYGSHRNKILARKDKKLTVMSPRSRSVPRDSEDVPSSPEIFRCFGVPRRACLRRVNRKRTIPAMVERYRIPKFAKGVNESNVINPSAARTVTQNPPSFKIICLVSTRSVANLS